MVSASGATGARVSGLSLTPYFQNFQLQQFSRSIDYFDCHRFPL